MSDFVNLEAEDVQRIDNVLADTGTPSVTRRSLVAKAAAGAAGAAALGAFGAPAALASSSSSAVRDIQTDAVTAEALAVTFLTGVIENASKIGIDSSLVPVLRAANAAELDHYKALRSLGVKPLTTKFWAPDAFFANSQSVFSTIEVAETLFINAYLIHTTAAAKAGMAAAARYGAEILGTEAEHRALARFALGKLPNNVGFEGYRIHHISGIVKALEDVGIGFGKEGKKPGAFYHFATPPSSALMHLENNRPA